MTTILDSGGLSAVALDRTLMDGLIRHGQWPPEVPAIVLTESLTGDPRRDHATDRILAIVKVHDVDERLGRRGAALRTAARSSRDVSAVDAVVVAMAEQWTDSLVLTSDLHDIEALTAHATRPIRVRRV